MKYVTLLFACLAAYCAAAQNTASAAARSGNPVFPGWYADPEGVVFGDTYWIYPTYSADYDEQTFMDAFSSKDLVHWQKHPRIVSNDEVKWVKRAMWAPAAVHANGKYYLFFAGNDIHEGET
nr:family 43 glycosylhydrolase [Alistipes sp.]